MKPEEVEDIANKIYQYRETVGFLKQLKKFSESLREPAEESSDGYISDDLRGYIRIGNAELNFDGHYRLLLQLIDAIRPVIANEVYDVTRKIDSTVIERIVSEPPKDADGDSDTVHLWTVVNEGDTLVVRIGGDFWHPRKGNPIPGHPGLVVRYVLRSCRTVIAAESIEPVPADPDVKFRAVRQIHPCEEIALGKDFVADVKC